MMFTISLKYKKICDLISHIFFETNNYLGNNQNHLYSINNKICYTKNHYLSSNDDFVHSFDNHEQHYLPMIF